MKFMFLTILLGVVVSCSSQINNPDTLVLMSGSSYYGKFVVESILEYRFIIGQEKKITDFPKGDVARIVKGDGTIYMDALNKSPLGKVEDAPKVEDINNENLLARFKELNNRTRKSGIYSEQSGNWGIASSVFIVGGTAMALVGVFTKTPALSYTGAGIGGTGFVFLIPTFAKLKKSGSVLRYRNSD